MLFILDSDLTVPPEDLPKFLRRSPAARAGSSTASRLVYPMEGEAMRFLNLLGNKFFSLAFTGCSSSAIKDTLCGTKVLRRGTTSARANRAFFGDFDPFGDFDLLFGAARLGLPLVEVPVRYRRRTSGYSKVQVYKHGILLLRMSLIGFRRLKLQRWLQRASGPAGAPAGRGRRAAGAGLGEQAKVLTPFDLVLLALAAVAWPLSLFRPGWTRRAGAVAARHRWTWAAGRRRPAARGPGRPGAAADAGAGRGRRPGGPLPGRSWVGA